MKITDKYAVEPQPPRTFVIEMTEAELTRLARMARQCEGGPEHPRSGGYDARRGIGLPSTRRFSDTLARDLGDDDRVIQRSKDQLPAFGYAWNV